MTEKPDAPVPGSRASVAQGLRDVAHAINAVNEDALNYLSTLTDDTYADDERTHQALNEAIRRMARLRFDLLQLERQIL